MVSPVVVQTKEGPKIMWSVESNVGLFSPNKTTDVELVQLAYRLRLQNPEAKKTDEERAAVAKIKPGAICTGKADDPLVQAIVAHPGRRRPPRARRRAAARRTRTSASSLRAATTSTRPDRTRTCWSPSTST